MRRLEDINNDFFVNHIDSDALAVIHQCYIPLVIAGAKSELPGRHGRDAKAWSTALSTALETAEAIDLDS